MRLLCSENKFVGAQFVHQVANPFEANKVVVLALYAVRLANLTNHSCRDQRCDHIMFGRQFATLFQTAQSVIGQHDADLVSGKSCPLGVVRGGQRCGNTQPITIWIGGHNKISIRFLAAFDDCIKNHFILWIGNMPRNIWEITVWFTMRFEDFDVIESGGVQ